MHTLKLVNWIPADQGIKVKGTSLIPLKSMNTGIVKVIFFFYVIIF